MPTGIEWCDEAWNPVTGCTPISEGCKNCYARRMANRLRGRCGYDKDDPFKVTYHPDRLEKPLHWKKPRKVFVNSMGDLFHDYYTEQSHNYLCDIMAVIDKCRQHTFMILTKRPEKMYQFFRNTSAIGDRSRWGLQIPDNLMLGASVENKKTINRIDTLLRMPKELSTYKKFISFEPLLEELNISNMWRIACYVDWVIAGPETGPGARVPKDVHKWIEDIARQCKAANVPFFDKRDPATPGFAERRWG